MKEIRVTVSQFNEIINKVLCELGVFVVEGEITQKNISTKGGVNIVLKDPEEQSIVNLSGFSPRIQGINLVNEGMQVAAWGVPQIWSPSGRFSINIFKILPLGAGALKEAYEQLKKALEKEGLFDVSRKRPLPDFITKIALLTAKNSAAFSDFIKILKENKANIEIDFYPVQVQGKNSEFEILSVLENIDENIYDCLVLIRGGGSLEDLITFNEEKIARKLFSLQIPTIVGVGHERDESIADFVADTRASTPSQAAYYIVQQNQSFIQSLQLECENIRQHIIKNLHNFKLNLSPKHMTLETYITTDFQNMKSLLLEVKYKLEKFENKIIDQKQKFENISRILRNIDPKNILKKGYSVVCSDEGKTIKSSKNLNINESLYIKFSQGQIKSNVTSILN